MPLTEREKQILREIEQNLYAEDPSIGKRVSPRTEHVRRIRLGAASFLLGLAILVAFFVTENPLVGVLAFGAMVAGVVLMARAAAGLASTTLEEKRSKERLVGTFRRWEQTLRERYRRS